MSRQPPPVAPYYTGFRPDTAASLASSPSSSKVLMDTFDTRSSGTANLDILQALRDGPTADMPSPSRTDTLEESDQGSFSSPPATGTAASFRSAHPLLHGSGSGKEHYDESFSYDPTSEESSLSNAPSQWATRSSKMSLGSDFEGCLPRELSSSRELPTPSGFNNCSARPSLFGSPNQRKGPPRALQLEAEAQPLSVSHWSGMPEGLSTAVDAPPLRASSAALEANPYTASLLPRSNIQINPFSQIRRRLSRSNTEQTQLFEELLQSLDDYIAAFAPSKTVENTGQERLITDDPLGPCPPNLSRGSLFALAQELDSTVSEIIDRFPDFRHGLINGAYGPYFLPAPDPLERPSERFSAHEPSFAEFVNGQWWASRLRKDLAECIPASSKMGATASQVSSSSLPAPFLGDRLSPQPSSESLKDSDGRLTYVDQELAGLSMSRAGSAASYRSAELLDEGQRRWEAFQATQ